MEVGDLPYQREPQSRTAVLAAAGLIHPEKGLEDALLILLRNAAAGIGNANQEFSVSCVTQTRTEPPGRLYLTAFSVRLKISR